MSGENGRKNEESNEESVNNDNDIWLRFSIPCLYKIPLPPPPPLVHNERPEAQNVIELTAGFKSKKNAGSAKKDENSHKL